MEKQAKVSTAFYFALFTYAMLATTARAATIYVPTDQPTIQAAISVAVNGDTVLVSPGTYGENVDFNGKAITVRSTGGPKVTVIDGGQKGTVVHIISGESRASQLRGFTLQNGMTSATAVSDGGGITIRNSSATIIGNIIQNNVACTGGGGIAVYHGSPLIRDNVIRNNSQKSTCFSGNGGAGISIVGAGSSVVEIVGNVIRRNALETGDGGGIGLDAAGTVLIQNNTITGKTVAGQWTGGGIFVGNASSPVIIQNLIYNNTAYQGGGIYLLMPQGNSPLLVNNTVVNNNSVALVGSAVYANGFDSQVQFFNNLLIGKSGQSAVYCDPSFSSLQPLFSNNDAFSTSTTGLQGTCADQSGQSGNISVDPMFAAVGDYRLTSGSQAIDTGTTSAPKLPKRDLAGQPRIVDGDDDGDKIVDMGAYEFQ